MPVMNESWRISRLAGGKKISQPMQELLEDDDVVGVRGWAERRNDNTSGRGRMEAEWSGREVCRRRRHFV